MKEYWQLAVPFMLLPARQGITGFSPRTGLSAITYAIKSPFTPRALPGQHNCSTVEPIFDTTRALPTGSGFPNILCLAICGTAQL